MANKGDVVLIGKGHEDYQVARDRTIHFDDKEIAKEVFKKNSGGPLNEETYN